MMGFEFATGSTGGPEILCLGAHSDDIEIGALATIMNIARNHPTAKVTWVVFSAIGDRADEAHTSAHRCTRDFETADIRLYEYRDSFFPSAADAIKATMSQLRDDCRADIVFTHGRDDRHQDHRVISDLTWQVFRDNLILEYEVPKYDGDFGIPNLFQPVSEDLADEKVSILEEFFSSQRSKRWFTPDLFRAVMRLRGMECNSASGMAEAFFCRKAVLG